MAASKLKSPLKTIRTKIDSATQRRKKQVADLRSKAAEAALNWVMAHESRIQQFRDAVAKTPVAGTVDKLIEMIKTEAEAPPKKAKAAAVKPAAKPAAAPKAASTAAPKKATVKKAAAKKAIAKKAPAKKAAAKKASKKSA
ncbi:hypothetical protein [Sinimarinibacterium sp. NLF-5-8]|uniref:hypothetical protein n=1 Tax=Sinimarinibacterium sp. NLF-5-8 TaxID=2698684 RepID=UPI00192EA2B1|nr:hypothetical protein [Sinimarinibacterium sp. NLF-5-8]